MAIIVKIEGRTCLKKLSMLFNRGDFKSLAKQKIDTSIVGQNTFFLLQIL